MNQKERIIQYVLQTPCNNNRQILESLLSDIDLQPDWSQNDETKKDYIKNRTHWVEHNKILEETAFTIESGNDNYELGEFEATLDVGDMLDIVYDGVAYTDTLYEDPGHLQVESDSFHINFEPIGDKYKITIWGSSENHTISISKLIYHPIPDEYIPNWVASVDNIMQPDWDQNNETAKDYIKGRPGGYYDEITTTTLDITATKQDESDKLTDVQVIEDNFRYQNNIDVEIYDSLGVDYRRTLTQRHIPEYVINEFGATIYGNAHLIAASEPDTGEDLAIFKELDGDSTYGIGWHIWAPSVSSGMLELSVIKTEYGPIPFPSDFIPWETSPTANSVLYTAQSLTDIQEEQARANIGAGTPYTLPQATAEALGGVKADSAEAADTQPVRIGGDGKLYTAPGGGTYYVELDGNFPNYTLSETTPLADITAAYNDGKAMFCKCSMGVYTATLPLFVPMAESNIWIFSGSGGAAAMNMPAQYFTIVVSAQGVAAEDKRIVQTDVIVTSVSASSTDSEVPSAKCLYDELQERSLKQATSEVLGGVKADPATESDTQPVRIGNDGKLVTAGGTDISLGLTSASVGQIIKVKAIDESGKPTEWEAVDIPSAVTDEHINSLIDAKLRTFQAP